MAAAIAWEQVDRMAEIFRSLEDADPALLSILKDAGEDADALTRSLLADGDGVDEGRSVPQEVRALLRLLARAHRVRDGAKG